MNASSAHEIRIPKAAELVARSLRRSIITGRYAVGDGLPNESQIMEQFNVARTTARDALRILEAERLVAVRRGAGGGASARAPGISAVTAYASALLQYHDTTVADVHAIRIAIEAPAARMLAERNDRSDVVTSLQVCLDHETEIVGDAQNLMTAEGEFHRRLVELTGNRAMILVSSMANRIVAMQTARMARTPRDASVEESRVAHRAHQKLLQLIVDGDGLAAEAHWTRHLEAGLEHLSNHPDVGGTLVDLMT